MVVECISSKYGDRMFGCVFFRGKVMLFDKEDKLYLV